MRRGFFASIVLAGVMTLASARPALGEARVSVSVFHRTLAPYGRWITTASYGDVWAPSVAVGWQPYVNGEWYYTDCGWTWASSDSWGDIPFHYGTWAWVPPYGWVWVPGTVWAPAWVTWAYSDDFIGWAPVPPSFALSVSGYVGTPVVLASSRYVFVPTRQFVGVRVASVRVPLQRNTTIFAHTTRTTRFQVASGVLHTVGPAPQRIARVAGHRIDPVPVAKAGVRPVSLTQSGVARERRFAVVAPKAERAAAVSKPSAASHARPSRKVEPSHRAAPANANVHPAQPARHAPAKLEKATAERAVSKPQRTGQSAAANTAKASSHAAKPAPRPEKRASRPPRPVKPEPQAQTVRREAPPQPRAERVAAARPAPKPQAEAARPHPQPNAPKPKQPRKPSPHPKNDGNGN
jgi:hypothetical protein